MDVEERLLIQAEVCLNNDDTENAQRILDELERREQTNKSKYFISQLYRDLGFKIGNISYLDKAIDNFEEFNKSDFEDINFSLGTAYALKYRVLKEKPNYLTKDYKNHLLFKSKKVLNEELSKNENVNLRKTLINLANVYDDIGRDIEAIDLYEEIIDQCGSAYALLNKGISLYNYSMFLNNPTPILSDAYGFFKLISNNPKSSVELKQKADFYIGKIKFLFDENILEEHVANDLERPTDETFKSFMTNYCLDNRLYLNLCNFCQICENSIGDTIGIDKMFEDILNKCGDDLFSVLSSYLNQLKMDYVSARFLLILSQYEGFDLDFITEHVNITETQFNEEYDFKIQLLKDSFENFFNVLDKIAYFMNDYLKLGIDSDKVDFRKIWYKYDKKKKRFNFNVINEKLIKMENKGLTALYDIFLEVEWDNEKEYLRKTRNSLTHKYLRISETPNENSKTIEEMHNEAIEIAILVKNAIIYLMRLVHINEKQKIASDIEFDELYE